MIKFMVIFKINNGLSSILAAFPPQPAMDTVRKFFQDQNKEKKKSAKNLVAQQNFDVGLGHNGGTCRANYICLV